MKPSGQAKREERTKWGRVKTRKMTEGSLSGSHSHISGGISLRMAQQTRQTAFAVLCVQVYEYTCSMNESLSMLKNTMDCTGAIALALLLKQMNIQTDNSLAPPPFLTDSADCLP